MPLQRFHKGKRSVLIDSKDTTKLERLAKAGYKSADAQPEPTRLHPLLDGLKYSYHKYDFANRHGFAGFFLTRSNKQMAGVKRVNGEVEVIDNWSDNDAAVPQPVVDWEPR